MPRIPALLAALCAAALAGRLEAKNAVYDQPPEFSGQNSLQPSAAQIRMMQGQGVDSGPGAGSISGSGNAVSGGGVGSSGGDTNPGVNPSVTKNASTYNAPAKKEEKKDQNGNQQPQMPQMPGGGQGDQQGGGGGSKGGGCSNCSKNLGNSTANLEKKLNEANPSDAATKQLIDRARQTVAQGKDAKGKLDNASDTLGKVQRDLDAAGNQIEGQNKTNDSDIKLLEAAQKKRDATVQSVQTAPPGCTPGGQGTYGQGSPAQAQQSQSGISSGKSGKSTADGLIQAASALPGPIGAAATLFQGAGVVAGSKLGTGSLGGAAEQISQMGRDAQAYLTAAQGAEKAADQAIQKTDSAREAAAKTAQDISQANTKAKDADTSVKNDCEAVEKMKDPYLQAQAKTPPDTATMTSLSSQAQTKKTSMEQKSKQVQTAIDNVKSQHQKAEQALKDARTAIKTLGMHLTGK